jgi:hypothetical protein
MPEIPVKVKYTDSNGELINGIEIGITLANLPSSTTGGRESNLFDNTTERYTSGRLWMMFKTVAGQLGTNPVVNIYAYPADRDPSGNLMYPTWLVGVDATVVTVPVPQLKFVGKAIPMISGYQQIVPIGPILPALGWTMPPKIGLIVQNITGLAFSANASENKLIWVPEGEAL